MQLVVTLTVPQIMCLRTIVQGTPTFTVCCHVLDPSACAGPSLNLRFFIEIVPRDCKYFTSNTTISANCHGELQRKEWSRSA